jgi:hypothetical protein
MSVTTMWVINDWEVYGITECEGEVKMPIRGYSSGALEREFFPRFCNPDRGLQIGKYAFRTKPEAEAAVAKKAYGEIERLIYRVSEIKDALAKHGLSKDDDHG